MLSILFTIFGILLAVFCLLFVIKFFMVKADIADSRFMFIIIWVMVVIAVWCSFIVVTDCSELTFLEYLKDIKPEQADRLHFLTTKLTLTLVIGYVVFGVQFILLKVMKKNLQENIKKNIKSNGKWNI